MSYDQIAYCTRASGHIHVRQHLVKSKDKIRWKNQEIAELKRENEQLTTQLERFRDGTPENVTILELNLHNITGLCAAVKPLMYNALLILASFENALVPRKCPI